MSTRQPALSVGQRIPSFELKNQHGDVVRSQELLGRGPVVIYFYPKDQTAGCTAQACSFRDANDDFARAGATIVGISSDDVESHKRFAADHKLNFTILADEGGHVRAQFGVEKGLLGLVDGRVTFIVDETGIVRHRYDSLIRATRHVDESVQAVRALVSAARPASAAVR